MKSLPRLSLLILFGALALLFPASPAGATSLAVSPPAGMPGTTLQIQGGGFSGGEGVQLWAKFKCPKNIVNCRGSGVYLNTNPNALYFFGCNWKWVPMGGTIYFLVLGFHPNESVAVSYEILGIQGMTHVTTVGANGSGYAAFHINSIGMRPGHYHWWFTSHSASYCGHYDHW